MTSPMRKTWHLKVLRHEVVRTEILGTTEAGLYGFVSTCNCGAWWVETVWREDT